MTPKFVIAVVGPTGIGKTKRAITLAKHYDTEIISADSRQFYREMYIGTAVPTKAELATVTHHFIQHRSIFEPYSVGDFERDALLQIKAVHEKRDVVIVVGGSGLYVDAVSKGLDEFPEVDPAIRKNLMNVHATQGIETLRQQLQKLDPDHFQQVDVHNPHRLIRALEICISSGRPYSSFLRKHVKSRPFHTLYVGLDAPREIVYQRIEQRIDHMVDQGLLPEVERLLPHKDLNALQTVGYKELFPYFEKKTTLEAALVEVKKNTRRFAKRQLTWYRKNPEILWTDFQRSPQHDLTVLNSIMQPKKDIYIVMGVSSTGKSTIGRLLAKVMQLPFFDGDDYHPQANIDKMKSGIPLNDDDRGSWLKRLNELAKEHEPTGVVLACSALKQTYRNILSQELPQTRFIHLKGTFEQVKQRMAKRQDHFMPLSLLQSQFDTLEIPKEAISVSIMDTPNEILNQIVGA